MRPAKCPATAAGESTPGATVPEMTSGPTALRILLYLTLMVSSPCHSDAFNDLFLFPLLCSEGTWRETFSRGLVASFIIRHASMSNLL